ncbi:hypothetical protein [Myxococcus sp. AS-1-15]|uniref:hypothetical protein n=1 Tax=Myxococcus sp. AS-1-15 TaxID=2874600 RepID=UPI001CBCFD74|nr:hypothetical protein [Myxococcus sp. AS-1-15]MBZ4398661.1 hypothetical protein [Myxococcus sp. AS-1-15]
MRLPRWVWAKLAHIAKREADAGKKSKRTRQKVSSNDVLMSACEHLITTDELTNGRINLPAIPPPERAAKKKPAAKKGRGT